MVTPQQRGQVVVKSIGDIQRETTVRARKANPASPPPSSNFGHTVNFPRQLPFIESIGILSRYWKIAQHPAHTMVAGMFVANKSPVSLSKVRSFGGKTGMVAKGILYSHLAVTGFAVVHSVYRGFKK